MNKRPLSSLSSPLYWGAFKIAGIYLLIGSLWILFSDRLAERIALNTEILTTLSLYKGWGFVIVTAFLLYWLIQGHTGRLHASEKRLQVVIDALPVLISYIDKSQHYQFANEAYEEWFGEKAEGKHIEEVVGHETYQKALKHIDKVLSGETAAYEATISDRDGSERFVSATYVPDLDLDGHVRGFFALVQDISEQKEAKEKLRQWADAFEGCAHGIAIGDPDTNRIVVCNPAFANMLKCRVEDIVGSSILSVYAAPDHEHVRSNVERADQIGHARYEARMVRSDHSTFPVEMDLVSVLGDDGELIYRVVTAQDISERKQSEEKLRKSEERYHYLFENNPHPMWIYDRKTLAFLDVNEAAIAKYGYSRQEFLSMTIIDIRPPEDVERLMNNLAQPRQPLERSNGWRHRLKDGTVIYVEISSHTIEIDGHESVLVVAQDVTERKQAEEALQRSQRLLQDVIDNSSSLIYLLDLEGRFLLINRSLESVLGRPREEVIGKPRDMFLSLENAAKHRANDIKVIETRSPITMEEENDQSDGKYIYLSNKFPLLDPNGNLYGVGGISADITERKQAEEAVRNSQAQMTGIFNSAMDAIISVDAEQRILIFNPAAEMMFRCKQSEAMGQSLDLFIPQRFRTNHRSHVQNFAQTGTTNRVMGHLGTIYGLRKDGEEFPIEASISKINLAGHDLFTVILRDITKRQQTEEALRESEEKFSVIYYKAPFAAALSSLPDGVIVDVNEAFEKVFGYTKQEVLGQTSLELGINPDPEARTRIAAELQARGSVHDLELMLHTKTGHARVFLMNIDLVSISGQKYIFQTAQDITERKQAGEDLQKAHAELEIKVQERTAALSQANSLLQALMDYMPDQIYFKDLQCRFIRNSRSQASLLGLNDPREVIGKTDFDFFPHAAKAFAEEQEVMKSGKSLIDFEEWVVWPDGRESWVSTTKVPLRNSEGETIGIFGISRDITERKHAEQAIRELNSDLENQAAKLQAANKEL